MSRANRFALATLAALGVGVVTSPARAQNGTLGAAFIYSDPLGIPWGWVSVPTLTAGTTYEFETRNLAWGPGTTTGPDTVVTLRNGQRVYSAVLKGADDTSGCPTATYEWQRSCFRHLAAAGSTSGLWLLIRSLALGSSGVADVRYRTYNPATGVYGAWITLRTGLSFGGVAVNSAAQLGSSPLGSLRLETTSLPGARRPPASADYRFIMFARGYGLDQTWRIIPTGAWAANALGLSTQVPAKIVYLSDGPNRKFESGKQTIYFKHAQPKEMRTEGALSGLVIQALRYLGKKQVGPQVIDHLRGRLSPSDKRRLVRDTRYSTDWIFAVARQVAEEDA